MWVKDRNNFRGQRISLPRFLPQKKPQCQVMRFEFSLAPFSEKLGMEAKRTNICGAPAPHGSPLLVNVMPIQLSSIFSQSPCRVDLQNQGTGEVS